MSNFLAIASVSAALRHLLQETVALDVPGATVSFERPSEHPLRAPTVHVLLVQANHEPDADVDLDGERDPLATPDHAKATLSLQYLLCFSGDQARLEQERLLGSVVRTLNERPILTRDILQRMSADATLPFVADSDLAQDVELVRFTPTPMSVGQIANLWSMMFQTSYVLSVAYRAGIVLIGSDEPSHPVAHAPVHGCRDPSSATPWLERVVDADDDASTISMSSSLVAYGHALDTAQRVSIGDIERPLADVSDARLTVDLSSFAPDPSRNELPLRAGVQTLRVVRVMSPHNDSDDDLQMHVSNSLPFVLSPQIESVHRFPGGGPPIDRHRSSSSPDRAPTEDGAADPARADKSSASAYATKHLEVRIRPPVADGQQVSLSLIPQEHGVPSYRLPLTRPPENNRDGTASVLTFPVHGVVEPGTYLARIRVDRVDSALIVDRDRNSPRYQRYIGPRVTVRR